MILTFLLSLMIAMTINYIVTITLGALGVAWYIIIIASSLIISIFFGWLSFRRHPYGVLKNPAFHKYIAINFVLLLLLNYLFNFIL